MSKGMIKVFLFYQRLARKEKLLLLLAGSQALCKSQEWSFPKRSERGCGEGAEQQRESPGQGRADPAPTGAPLLWASPTFSRARQGEAGSQARLFNNLG